MALNFKKAGVKASTNSMSAMLAKYQKDMGEEIGSFGGKLPPASRVPTGLFPLDLALAGGFPRGKCTMIYGPESSNKTNIALRAIAQHQLLWPDKLCAFVDLEGGLDPDWARALGVDVEKLIVVKPAFAEQAVNMVEGFLCADDCGLVVLDSLAALVTSSELDNSAERANVGGATSAIGKLYRKTTVALNEAEKQDRYPTLIYINQVTFKIGVMFGDPETTPGGKKPPHQASIILRCYGKNKMDTTISKAMPVAKEVNFIIKKYKCPILAASGRFEMATIAHGLLNVGQCDDFNTVSEYLKAYGLFAKGEKKGWTILGESYDTIAPFKERLYSDGAFGQQVRQNIIDRMLSAGKLMTQDEKVDDDDV